ncbi:glutamine synthetase family protein [Clostridium aminobutyricum]|uniref:Glutamine synthetase n=1 Tax=Clostridium aminobutyricum TaxID=33953 RepID=A0A939D8U4_CLOAM|nr:glutamine synthetase family protein [Clostridium aminobutyricum]MBN7773589.1 glutamine synthetase [Clostridium aminobutyricum]
MSYTIQDLEKVKAYIKEHLIDSVEIGFADINGSIIGKRLPARFLLEHMTSGTGVCRAPLTWDIQSEYFSTSKFAGFEYGASDMILKPDYSTLREIPWRKGTAFVLADLDIDTGERIQVAPRQILKNVLARLENIGYTAKVGSEIEFYLLDENKRSIFGGKQAYSIGKASQFSDIIDQLQRNLEAFNIPVEAIHTEYGPGQIEVIFEYSDALTNADNTIIGRNAIKEIARKNGLYATFMAKPWDTESGSGYHLHQSLWTKEGRNAFAEDKNVLEQYAAGLLSGTSEFMALVSPTVNSYKRLTDMSFAPTKVGIGYDNRTVSTRLVGHGNSTRIEQRTGAADANAYFLIAASIASGLYGLEHKLPASRLIEGNGYFNDELPNIPRTLKDAAVLFDKSEKAIEYFGKDFVEIFSELIHFDISVHDTTVSDWERDRYLENS